MTNFRKSTEYDAVILANGTFPRKGGEARRLLETVRTVVACDGAAGGFRRRMGREADFVVGDMDSLGCGDRGSCRMIRIEEQDTNDLAKAVGFCRGRGLGRLVIVGATGKREDHSLGNIFRAMEAGIEVVTDHGRFIPFAERIAFRATEGQPVSVFATDRRVCMKSKGLVWPLDGVRFENLYCATLNRAEGGMVEIETTCPAFVYVAFNGGSPHGRT